jgi:hypothetical protein
MARKNRPGRSGVRGRKADFSPPNAPRRYEIVEEIVDQLRPWKHRVSEATVTDKVIDELRLLLLLAPLEAKRPNRTQNRIHAQRLDSALHEVETLLASAPDPLCWFLLNPLPTRLAQGGLEPARTPEVESIERANRERADSFAAELKRLRQVCARGTGSGFGYHPNYEPRKYFCAYSAYRLMERISDRPITGTKDARFRSITSLLYEAVSGQSGVDLKRACDSCLAKTGASPVKVQTDRLN